MRTTEWWPLINRKPIRRFLTVFAVLLLASLAWRWLESRNAGWTFQRWDNADFVGEPVEMGVHSEPSMRSYFSPMASAEWQGWCKVESGRTVELLVEDNGWVGLFIDGAMSHEALGFQVAQRPTIKRLLSPGTHSVRVRYFAKEGPKHFQLTIRSSNPGGKDSEDELIWHPSEERALVGRPMKSRWPSMLFRAALAVALLGLTVFRWGTRIRSQYERLVQPLGSRFLRVTEPLRLRIRTFASRRRVSSTMHQLVGAARSLLSLWDARGSQLDRSGVSRGSPTWRRLTSLCTFALFSTGSLWLAELYYRQHALVGLASLLGMMDGTVAKPFVFRSFVPDLLRALDWVTPHPVKALIGGALLHTPRLAEPFARHGYPEGEAFVFAVFIALVVVANFSLAASTRALVREGLPHLPFVGCISGLASLATAPLVTQTFFYCYDPFCGALFGLALLALQRRRFGWFLGFFTLSCWNKETAILLTGFFMLHWGWRLRTSLPGLAARCGVQLAIWGLFRYMALRRFDGDLESTHYWYLEHNIGLLASPAFSMIETAGFVAFALLFFHRWSRKPAFLRDASSMILPLAALWVPFGFSDFRGGHVIYEFRIFLEVWPVIVPLAAIPVAEAVQKLRLAIWTALESWLGSGEPAGRVSEPST